MSERMIAVRYLNFDGLLNMGVSSFLRDNNELSASKNVYVYEIGKLEKVPGYSKAASNVVVSDTAVNHLSWYYDSGDGNNYLIAGSNTGDHYTFRYISPNHSSPVTSWTTISGISTSLNTFANSNISTVNYLDKMFIVGHKSGSTFFPNSTINGNTFSTADSDLDNMPQGKYIVRYRDLLYVLNAKVSSTQYPSRAYYNDEILSGAIDWTPATNFVAFGYDDGDEITGGGTALDRLIVFKRNSMWAYDENSVSQISSIGCDSYKSILNVGGILYWFNRYGFWRWSGGMPQLISSKIQPLIDAMDQAALSSVFAVEDNFEYRAYIGNISHNGITYNNAWFCFNTLREQIYIRCTGHTASCATRFIVNNTTRSYFGISTGYVEKFATKIDGVYSDDGLDIDSFFITNDLDHGNPEDVKHTNHLVTFSKNPQGLRVTCDADGINQFRDGQVQTIQRNVDNIDFSVSGNRIRYKFSENGRNMSWEFEGFVILTNIKEEER